MATTTISKIERQAEMAAARAEYIHSAEVSLHGDYALVRSRTTDDVYTVQIEGGLPVSCQCSDFYYRSRRDPSHVCLHMDATQVKLCATLPMMGTPEMGKLIKSAEKIFKVRRSAPSAQLIASLQIAVGVKVRMSGSVLVVKSPKVVAPVALVSPVVELMAA